MYSTTSDLIISLLAERTYLHIAASGGTVWPLLGWPWCDGGGGGEALFQDPLPRQMHSLCVLLEFHVVSH